MSPPIVVVDPDPKWPDTFTSVRRDLFAALAAVPVLAIEHVGSTSVPGLPAKPVIDIDIVVRRPYVGLAAEALERAGYVPLGEMGVVDRFAFKPPDDGVRRNVYVTVEGCLSLRNHLAVRSVLRRDPELRDAYASVKRRLATETDDIDVYVEGKSRIVRLILEQAGLSAAELDDIESINLQ